MRDVRDDNDELVSLVGSQDVVWSGRPFQVSVVGRKALAAIAVVALDGARA
jgi:hypothetical protein